MIRSEETYWETNVTSVFTHILENNLIQMMSPCLENELIFNIKCKELHSKHDFCVLLSSEFEFFTEMYTRNSDIR